MSPMIDIVYRGPFQGRRIRFILDSLDRLGARQRLYWLNPARGDAPTASLAPFAASRPNVETAVELDGRPRASLRALRSLGRARGQGSSLTVAIGFTSLLPARTLRSRRVVWCVNGIPEERLLYRDDISRRLAVKAMWASTRLGRRPDLVVTVSRPMAALVNEHLGAVPTFAAPTVVDRSSFPPRPAGPGVLTYVGSGAPWQDLPLLAEIWSEVHRIEPDVGLRVVSRDERAGVLAARLPAGAVEQVSARGPAAVAAQLRDSQLGFIVRRPHLVNEVSFPTKFGEYVSSAVGVVTSDIGWDIGEVVRSTGCGVLVDVARPPGAIAEEVVHFMKQASSSSDVRAACERAAAGLDRETWVCRLGERLAELI